MKRSRFLSRFLPDCWNAARKKHAVGPVCRPPRFNEERSGSCGECTACRNTCPSAIIVQEHRHQGPILDFSRGRCTFCYLCAGACPKGVLTLPDEGGHTAIGAARLTKNRCLAREGCSVCVERCPEGALTLILGRTIRVSEQKCTGCGNCEYVCPVEPKAICIEPLNCRP